MRGSSLMKTGDLRPFPKGTHSPYISALNKDGQSLNGGSSIQTGEHDIKQSPFNQTMGGRFSNLSFNKGTTNSIKPIGGASITASERNAMKESVL